MYTAYVLGRARETLIHKFPPKYREFYGHHVTVEFGVKADAELPPPANVRVVGYINSEDGLEALVASVNGTTKRPDGGTYHITWSLDPDSDYQPVDSNKLIQTKQFTMVLPIELDTTPELLS